MRKIAKLTLGGALIGLAAFAVPAYAEDAPKLLKSNAYLVFVDGDGSLSPVASETIQKAAASLKNERSITLEGKPAYVQQVKSELVRNGVSPRAIKDQSVDLGQAISSDAFSTAERCVEIKR
jgi:hypothetical protein